MIEHYYDLKGIKNSEDYFNPEKAVNPQVQVVPDEQFLQQGSEAIHVREKIEFLKLLTDDSCATPEQITNHRQYEDVASILSILLDSREMRQDTYEALRDFDSVSAGVSIVQSFPEKHSDQFLKYRDKEVWENE